MKMLTVDQRPFKEKLHELISETDVGQPKWVDAFRSEVERLAQAHRIVLSAKEYSGQLAKLIMANNKRRARKLVDVLDDKAVSRAGVVVLQLFKLALLAAGVFVVWFVRN